MPYLLLLIGCIGISIASFGLYFSTIQHFDLTAVVWMSEHRIALLDLITIGLSTVGGLPATLFICALWCVYLVRQKSYYTILFICGSVASGSIFGWILKYLVDRPRPEAALQMVNTYGASFPSAHSIYAAIISALILFILHKHSAAKVIGIFACLWFLSMGISRIYLGAHYPTDVLAGWSIGFICIAIMKFIISYIKRHKNKLFLDKNLNEVE